MGCARFMVMPDEMLNDTVHKLLVAIHNEMINPTQIQKCMDNQVVK